MANVSVYNMEGKEVGTLEDVYKRQQLLQEPLYSYWHLQWHFHAISH